MALDDLVDDKGGDIEKERKRGECPICEQKGKQLSPVEWKCTTNRNECSVLWWYDWRTEVTDFDD